MDRLRNRLQAGLVLLAAFGLAHSGPAIAEDDVAPPAAVNPETQAWNFHGQGTVVVQGNAPFRSPYEGDNSLRSRGETKETVSATGALGLRLWSGGELYIDAEAFQGFGLARTHGLGGYSNGEAQKGGSLIPQYYIPRYFYRHTFGLGGETEKVADDFNQLAGTRDVSRLTLTAGRFAVNDLFDQNKFAHDPREQFLNYSIWAAGAFDYAVDQKGYGAGAALELNQKTWAFRSGYFLLPIHSNAQHLGWNLGQKAQLVNELELRYQLFSQPGILRTLGWASRANAGSYGEALGDPNFDADQSIVDTRRVRTQYGYGVNLEQAITKDLGLFARWSWRDGRSEVISWTDIDNSLSGGLSLKGTAWQRPKDTVGLGAALNGLSAEHRAYGAAGGNSVLIGDGQLNYSRERILETYYSADLGFGHHSALTFDYQYITNPAYNADRGPVSIFAVRLHSEF